MGVHRWIINTGDYQFFRLISGYTLVVILSWLYKKKDPLYKAYDCRWWQGSSITIRKVIFIMISPDRWHRFCLCTCINTDIDRVLCKTEFAIISIKIKILLFIRWTIINIFWQLPPDRSELAANNHFIDLQKYEYFPDKFSTSNFQIFTFQQTMDHPMICFSIRYN